MLKKVILTKVLTQVASYAARKEAKILLGTVLTIGTHKMIQKAARKFSFLSFLRVNAK
ncbi:MAG TPA: hypothetical protein VNJ01_07610 [Bacteriovoracaceae bacterium]|nr:hypothetical protein [Bacteriovoracaceae bacterium]